VDAKRIIYYVAVAVFLAGCMSAEEKTMKKGLGAARQSGKVFAKKITKKVGLKYLLYLPQGYGEGNKKWPLAMFLHGAGERGDDLELVKKHGPPKMVSQGKDFEFVIISPQCPEGVWWSEKAETLIALLDEIETRYDVDKDRVYLTGLSMGGFGSWTLGCYYPERFAAVAPICGGFEPYLAEKMKDVPVWAFHGAKDDVVPLRRSSEMVEGLKKAGGDAKLTVYPEADHDSWTQTYNNPELYEWFLKHRISDKNKSE